MSAFLESFGSLLFFSFVACCMASLGLQLVAWLRHARPGVPVDVRALWKPDGYFDGAGLFQMRLARSLLLVGAVAYLSYGLLIFLAGRAGG